MVVLLPGSSADRPATVTPPTATEPALVVLPPDTVVTPRSGPFRGRGATLRERLSAVLLPCIGIAIVFGVWELVAKVIVKDHLLFPSVESTFAALWHLLSSGEINQDLWISAKEFLIGYAIAVGVGLTAGAIFAMQPVIARMFSVVVQAGYVTPLVAVAPLIIVIVGVGVWSKITMVAMLAVFPIIINTESGLKSLDPQYLETARAFRANRGQTLVKVILPGSAVPIVTGLRLGVAGGIIGVVVGEFFGAYAGLGFRVAQFSNAFQTADTMAIVLLLAFVGIIANGGLRYLERRLPPFRVSSGRKVHAAPPAVTAAAVVHRRGAGILRCAGIEHNFGAKGARAILTSVDLEISEGEFLSIVGPSGCGKTTMLRIAAGLVRPVAGTVNIDDRDVTGQPSAGSAMVFQNDRLFPWRTALRNVTFGLEITGVGRTEATARAYAVLDLVGLAGHEHMYPGELSGGMRQRVNLARALVLNPSVLLMDEPFAALDAQNRELMQRELLRILSDTGMTVLFVTHQIDEALFLSDRVVVFGSPEPQTVRRVVQVPFSRPRNPSVRRSEVFQDLTTTIWTDIEREVGDFAETG